MAAALSCWALATPKQLARRLLLLPPPAAPNKHHQLPCAPRTCLCSGMSTWEVPLGYGRSKPDVMAYGRDVQVGMQLAAAVLLHLPFLTGGCGIAPSECVDVTSSISFPDTPPHTPHLLPFVARAPASAAAAAPSAAPAWRHRWWRAQFACYPVQSPKRSGAMGSGLLSSLFCRRSGLATVHAPCGPCCASGRSWPRCLYAQPLVDGAWLLVQSHAVLLSPLVLLAAGGRS